MPHTTAESWQGSLPGEMTKEQSLTEVRGTACSGLQKRPPLRGSVLCSRNSNSKTARGWGSVQKGEGSRGGQPSEKPQKEFWFD